MTPPVTLDDAWIRAQRPARRVLDPWRPHAFLREAERAEDGAIVPVATVFLTNRECPWRCLMCDLWQHTLTETVPAGAIPAQIGFALDQLRRATAPPEVAGELRQLKLYNSGSFFDSRAIPEADYAAIAERVGGFERVIVECHPALVGERALRFRDLLATSARRAAHGETPAPKLEVAMGLETAHPEVLRKLNKRMTLDDFAAAASFLKQHDLALRVFVLVKPPFLDEAEALDWAKRSIDFAFSCGASVVSLIPTRFGNGALEALAARGDFSPPRLATLEAAAAYGVGLHCGRAFADVWDLEKFSDCSNCFPARAARLREMNARQSVPPEVGCEWCSFRL